jgi:hypothetical protein
VGKFADSAYDIFLRLWAKAHASTSADAPSDTIVALAAQPVEKPNSCGFFCRPVHTDHVPSSFVILTAKTENHGSFSYFYYQLYNKEGQKLTGKGYAVEERFSGSHPGHTSEGHFVPATNG